MTRGREQKPHAYVIPALVRQRDPRRTAYLVNQLRRHGVEVHRRTVGDSTGDFVVLLNQPYRDLAVNLLSVQRFPQSAQYPPYDDIAWTLGYLYGVEVRPLDDAAVFAWPGLESLRDSVTVASAIRGEGNVYVVAYRAQSELLPALYWVRGREPRARFSAIEEAAVVGRDTFPPGSVILQGISATTARTSRRPSTTAGLPSEWSRSRTWSRSTSAPCATEPTSLTASGPAPARHERACERIVQGGLSPAPRRSRRA
jgi:hypothetical protein